MPLLDTPMQHAMRQFLAAHAMPSTVTFYTVTRTPNAFGEMTKSRTQLLVTQTQYHQLTARETDIIRPLVAVGLENVETRKCTIPFAALDAQTSTLEADTPDGLTWSVVHIISERSYMAATEVFLIREVVTPGTHRQ